MNNSSVLLESAGQEYCKTREMPSEAYRKYRITIEVYIVSIVCVFGFIGNSLSIAVLCRDKDRKNATNWLLQTLAVVDSLYLVCCLFIQTVTCIQEYTDWIPPLVQVFPYIQPWIWAIASCVQTITVWMVLLVTIDRYAAICKPLNTQLRTEHRARWAVALVCLVAILYNIPRFLEREVRYKYEPDTNRTIPCTVWTPMRESSVYILVYKTVMYLVFRSVGPLVILIYINIRLILTLLLIHRKQKEMTTKKRIRRRGENINTMLIAVVTVFIICEIPDTMLRIIYIINMYSNAVTIEDSTLRVALVITNLLLTINSSINFIIYCLMGKKFRNILARMTNCVSVPSLDKTEVSETEPLTLRTVANQNCAAAAVSTNGASTDVRL